jgi:phosphate starvation-inducible PhoH-like protein
MTFKNTFVICEDMQYSTPEEILMLITRIGINSRIVINGDTTCTSVLSTNGLNDIINKLYNIKYLDFIKYVQLTTNDIQRHPLINNILKAYN